MNKLSVIAFALFALLACNSKNEPAQSSSSSGDYFMSYCYYWTSTPYDQDAKYAYNANDGSRSTNSGADEISNDVEDGSISYRHYTFFVRLVR